MSVSARGRFRVSAWTSDPVFTCHPIPNIESLYLQVLVIVMIPVPPHDRTSSICDTETPDMTAAGMIQNIKGKHRP